MKKLIVASAIMLASFSAHAVGVFESDAYLGMYKVVKAECASGALEQSYAKQLIGQVSNSRFLQDRGASLVENGSSAIQVVKVSGSAGICNNGGEDTLLVMYFQKSE